MRIPILRVQGRESLTGPSFLLISFTLISLNGTGRRGRFYAWATLSFQTSCAIRRSHDGACDRKFTPHFRPGQKLLELRSGLYLWAGGRKCAVLVRRVAPGSAASRRIGLLVSVLPDLRDKILTRERSPLARFRRWPSHVHVSPRRQIALLPALVLALPLRRQSGNHCRRQVRCVLAQE